ncbi:transposase [Bradyrhizobium frederickii]|uniref:transposase n=1 Tax=Bradyrhizobium frederickii TaxID=2560054 RepID=UPI003D3235A3
MAADVRFGCVLADAGYGLSAPFRQGLTERGLVWAVGSLGILRCIRLMYSSLADYQSPREAKAPRTRNLTDCGRTNADQSQMEKRELAQRKERSSESPICCCPCPHRRRPSAADMG